MSSAVSRPPAADSARALKHFEKLLEFETDCWDVHHAITNNRKDFVLLDVRGGRPTPPELVAEIRERYRATGGKSPAWFCSTKRTILMIPMLQPESRIRRWSRST